MNLPDEGARQRRRSKTKMKFNIIIDNNPFTNYDEVSAATGRRTEIGSIPFHFEIRYQAATHSGNADALSGLSQISTPKIDIDICFEQLTQTTLRPPIQGI